MASSRATPWPENSWSNSTASSVPRPDRDREHPAHQEQRVGHGRPQGRVGQQEVVVVEAGEAADRRVEQVVALEGEPQRHRQRHDHPEEQEDHRRRDQRPVLTLRWLRPRSGRSRSEGFGIDWRRARHLAVAHGWRKPTGRRGGPAERARRRCSSLRVPGLLHGPLGRALRRLERLVDRRLAGQGRGDLLATTVPMPWNSGIATYWMPL